MLTTLENYPDSLGNEPIELLGIENEEDLNKCLMALMEEIKDDAI